MIRTGFLLLFVTSISLYAHSINVFADYEGNVLKGKAYSGGHGIARVTVIFLNGQGQRLGLTKTDAEGLFEFKPEKRETIECLLALSDGHECRYRVETTPNIAPEGTVTNSQTDLSDLKRQVNHLEIMIHEQSSKTGMRDIIGGIGYILGLAGFVVLIKNKKPVT